jgi:hypothetical protein
MSDPVRWTLSVSEETDVALRTFLAQSRLKKGDLSKFVEEAVQWRLLSMTIEQARTRNEHLEPEEIESAVDRALEDVRAEQTSQRG